MGHRNVCALNLPHLLCANALMLRFYSCFKPVFQVEIGIGSVGHVDNVNNLVGILEYQMSSLPMKHLVQRW